MKEVRKVALWGLALYITFLAIILLRLGPFARDRISSLTFADTTKLAFHLFLLAAGVLELINYTATAFVGRGTHVAYSCHLLALWLQLLAFSAVLVLWSRTLRPPQPQRHAKRHPNGSGFSRGTLNGDHASGATASGFEAKGGRSSLCEGCRTHAAAMVVGVVDGIVLGLTAVVIATPSADQASSYPYILLSMTYGLVLFALASWLVVYGLRLQRRVMDHPRWEPLDRGARLRILLRINGVLLVCAVCFLLRVAVLSSTLAMSSSKRLSELSGFAFEALARWIPTLLPAIALTHIMRKAEPTSSSTSTSSGGGGGGRKSGGSSGWRAGGVGAGGSSSAGKGVLDGDIRVLDGGNGAASLKEPLLDSPDHNYGQSDDSSAYYSRGTAV